VFHGYTPPRKNRGWEMKVGYVRSNCSRHLLCLFRPGIRLTGGWKVRLARRTAFPKGRIYSTTSRRLWQHPRNGIYFHREGATLNPQGASRRTGARGRRGVVFWGGKCYTFCRSWRQAVCRRPKCGDRPSYKP